MAGVFKGLVVGLVVGLVAVAAVSLLGPPITSDATAGATDAGDGVIERTSGPPQSGLPRLTSETAPARPPASQGEE